MQRKKIENAKTVKLMICGNLRDEWPWFCIVVMSSF